jgi:hypothetical protein
MNVYIRRSLASPSNLRNSDPFKEYCLILDKSHFARFLGALTGTLAIVPALVSYEESYSLERTIEHCSINSHHTTPYRIISLILSLIGIFFELLYRYFYFKALKFYPLTFEKRPPPRPVSFLDVIEMTRPRSVFELFFNRKSFIIIILFLILPYPYMNIEIHIDSVILYQKVSMCYYLEEIFLFLMLFRIFYLLAVSLSFGMLNTTEALRKCEKNCVKVTPIFTLKAYAYIYPIQVIGFLIFIPGMFILAYGIKIFESPLMLQDLENIENCLWLTYITMMTIGYGDRYPVSRFGRLTSVLTVIWGGVFLSVIFTKMREAISFNNTEKSAYLDITTSKESGKIIKSFEIYSKAKIVKSKSLKEEKNKLQSRILRKISSETLEEQQIRVFNSILYEFNHDIGLIGQIEMKLRNIRTYLNSLPKPLKRPDHSPK